jgi:hypothetical protein
MIFDTFEIYKKKVEKNATINEIFDVQNIVWFKCF